MERIIPLALVPKRDYVIYNKRETKGQTSAQERGTAMKNVIISRNEVIENSAYYESTGGFGFNAYTSDGTFICRFTIKGNYSRANLEHVAGEEVWYEDSPSRGFAQPRNAKWELAFENWRGKYLKLAK